MSKFFFDGKFVIVEKTKSENVVGNFVLEKGVSEDRIQKNFIESNITPKMNRL